MARPIHRTPTSYWQPLFDHMIETHGITLLETEMAHIATAVRECETLRTEQIIECPMCRNQEPDRNTCPECLGAGEV